MTTILVPSDLSKNSASVINFAVFFARQHKAKLILLHAYELPYSSGPIAFDIIQSEQEEKTSKALYQLKALCETHSTNAGVVCDYHVLEGPPADTIADFTKKHPVDLIIMGARSEKGIGEIYFGRTTEEVILKSSCPVIAIPNDMAALNTLQKVSYATDFLPSDLDSLTLLASWLSPFNSLLSLVHVNSDPGEMGADANKLAAFTKVVEEETGYRKLSYELLEGEDAESALVQYIRNKKTDILVMSTATRGSFGRIFNVSLTSHLAQLSHLPIIAFHHPKKEKQMTL